MITLNCDVMAQGMIQHCKYVQWNALVLFMKIELSLLETAEET